MSAFTVVWNSPADNQKIAHAVAKSLDGGGLKNEFDAKASINDFDKPSASGCLLQMLGFVVGVLLLAFLA